MPNYPNPCDKCERSENCTRYKDCQPWKARYLYRQKQINAYAKKHLPDYEERKRKGVNYDHQKD